MKRAEREVTMDLAATDETVPFGLGSMTWYSVQIETTEDAALDGVFKLQSSNNAFTDNVGFPESIMYNPDADWTDIPGSNSAVTESGTSIWNVSDAAYGAVRVVWTSTAGTGSAVIKFEAKGIQ
jgi:hypothetical protein